MYVGEVHDARWSFWWKQIARDMNPTDRIRRKKTKAAKNNESLSGRTFLIRYADENESKQDP